LISLDIPTGLYRRSNTNYILFLNQKKEGTFLNSFMNLKYPNTETKHGSSKHGSSS
jgi:hypothetical protein